MVFIKPTIIRDNASIRGLSNRKYSLIRAHQLLQQEDGVALMPHTNVPVLPKYGETKKVSPEIQRYLDEQSEKPALLNYQEKDVVSPEAQEKVSPQTKLDPDELDEKSMLPKYQEKVSMDELDEQNEKSDNLVTDELLTSFFKVG